MGNWGHWFQIWGQIWPPRLWSHSSIGPLPSCSHSYPRWRSQRTQIRGGKFARRLGCVDLVVSEFCSGRLEFWTWTQLDQQMYRSQISSQSSEEGEEWTPLAWRDISPVEYFMSERCSRPTTGSANTEQFASASAALTVRIRNSVQIVVRQTLPSNFK